MFEAFVRLCGRLFTIFCALLMSGWTLFRLAQGATWWMLVLPAVLISVIVWWLRKGAST